MTFTDTITGRGKHGLSVTAIAASFSRAQAAFGRRKFSISRITRMGRAYSIVYGTARVQLSLDRLRDKIRYY